ncbi:MAG: nitrilase family protein [Tannerella sp.]|jgi:predicted amidohydrolase|nr:nitrilase family protein [Tannerella sp.]
MEDFGSLRISMVQSHIVWEDVNENIGYYGELLRRLKGKTDLAVLPELFTTGLSLRVEDLSEPDDGNTIRAVKTYARDYDLAVTGSFMASSGDGRYFNRAFFITPDGQEFYYNKRHLFSMAGEDKYFSSGTSRLVVDFRGWKICLMVCYDLRFPVWSRNVDNEYDVLIYVANWAEARKKVWKSLLQARAIENMCYVCGVNRIGIDAHEFKYHGGSLIISPKGKKLFDAGEKEAKTVTGIIKRADLDKLRTKFPVWKDADEFELKI